jgi:PAS domain S-box-containing protein
LPRWRSFSRGSPFAVVAIYAIVSFAWVAFSDRVLGSLVRDPSTLSSLQTAKGALFVLATSVLLYALIRRSEAGLRALSAEVRATVDSIADAVLVVDGDARLVEANRAAARLLGLSSKEELIGLPLAEWGTLFELRYPDGSRVPPDRYATVRALAGETVAAYEAVVRRRDGTDVCVSVSAAPVEARGGQRLAVAVIRDVTEARRLDEMRDEFLSTAAHELKTPLAVIKAYAQLLQRRDAAEKQPLTVIQRQVDRLNRIVQHLLDTTRLRLEAVEPRREPFDLAALAAEVVERTKPAAPSHELRFEAPGPAPVFADRERIARVVTSLLDNAIKYSPGGGPVDARVEVRGGEAVLTVKDRGLGIGPEHQAGIFQRYYRAHAGLPVDQGGLGLSLDVSREIVVRHGGRMWFESAPGEGSTFHLALPGSEARS